MGRCIAVLAVVAAALMAVCGCGGASESAFTGSYVGAFSSSGAPAGEMTMTVVPGGDMGGGVVSGAIITTTSGSAGSYTYSGNISSSGVVQLTSVQSTTGVTGIGSTVVTYSGTLALGLDQLSGTLTLSTGDMWTLALSRTASGTTPDYAGEYNENLSYGGGATGSANLIVSADGSITGNFLTATTDTNYLVTGTINNSGGTTLTGGGDTYTGTLSVNSSGLSGTLKDIVNDTLTLTPAAQTASQPKASVAPPNRP